MTDLLHPEQIDDRLDWAPGTAARMARRKRLPYYQLPDGSIRFRWAEVEALIRHVQPCTLMGEGVSVAS